MTYSPLSVRQAEAQARFPIAIDAETAQMGAQKVIETFTCSGIGGIAAAALGAMAAAKANASMMSMAMGQAGPPLDSTVLQALPRGPIVLSSEGNMFEIVIESQSLKINGLALIPFAVITGLHGKLWDNFHVSSRTLQLTYAYSTICWSRFPYIPSTIPCLGSSLAILGPHRLPSGRS